MTPQEFSDQFDVLFNNITSNQAPGLNEYEKSLFLTKAQDELLKNYFLPQSNAKQAGFDDNAKRQIDFSCLTTAETINKFSAPLFDVRSESRSVTLPSDVMFIIHEMTRVLRNSNTVILTTVPIKYDEYSRLMSKPYKRPVKYQAWRLINYNVKNTADLVVGPNDIIINYSIRYVRKPKPIIVGDLDGLTIDRYTYGMAENQAMGCELDSSLHEEILQRAIELAKVAWTSDGQSNAQLMFQAGQRSE